MLHRRRPRMPIPSTAPRPRPACLATPGKWWRSTRVRDLSDFSRCCADPSLDLVDTSKRSLSDRRACAQLHIATSSPRMRPLRNTIGTPDVPRRRFSIGHGSLSLMPSAGVGRSVAADATQHRHKRGQLSPLALKGHSASPHAGCTRRQCSAMSRPVQIHTRSRPAMWSRKRTSPVIRPGRPISRSCRASDISFGRSAPSA